LKVLTAYPLTGASHCECLAIAKKQHEHWEEALLYLKKLKGNKALENKCDDYLKGYYKSKASQYISRYIIIGINFALR